MMLGLQVLRIHVSELCKVKELCRDFSRRYITRYAHLHFQMSLDNIQVITKTPFYD